MHAPSYALAEGGQIIIDAIRRNARERREQAAAAFDAQVKRSGMGRSEWRTSDADAAEALALHARYADLLVIGTHGRTGLAKFFLGSVATRLVASAPCPVLTVRGR